MSSDNFNRANESPLASPWAQCGSMDQIRIVSNEVAGITDSVDNISRYTLSSVAFSQCRIANPAAGGGSGPGIHFDAGGNGYAGLNFGSTLFIVRWDGGGNGSATTVVSGAGSYAANDIVSLRRSGSNIILSVNDIDVLTGNDSTHTAGNPGLYAFQSAVRLDDWTDGADGGLSIPVVYNHYRKLMAA